MEIKLLFDMIKNHSGNSGDSYTVLWIVNVIKLYLLKWLKWKILCDFTKIKTNTVCSQNQGMRMLYNGQEEREGENWFRKDCKP